MEPYVIQTMEILDDQRGREEIIVLVNETVQESSSQSVRKLAAEAGMERETARRILKKYL